MLELAGKDEYLLSNNIQRNLENEAFDIRWIEFPRSSRGIYSQELSSSNKWNFSSKNHLFPPKIRYFSQLIYGGKMIVEGAGPQESIYPFPPIFWFLPSPGWWTMVFQIGLNMLLYMILVWYSSDFLSSLFFSLDLNENMRKLVLCLLLCFLFFFRDFT